MTVLVTLASESWPRAGTRQALRARLFNILMNGNELFFQQDVLCYVKGCGDTGSLGQGGKPPYQRNETL